MQKNILRRVRAGEFCAHVRVIVEKLPSILDIEKAEIIKEIGVMEAQCNAMRRNEYLEMLNKSLVPNLRHTVHILRLQLAYASADDENAKSLLSFINAHFTGERSNSRILAWVEGFLTMDAPSEFCAEAIFLVLQEQVRKIIEIRDLCAVESARLTTIGRSIDTRMRVIDLLFQAMDVAKGCCHRRSTRAAALDAIDTLEMLCAELRKHLPRKKRRVEKEEGKEDVSEAVGVVNEIVDGKNEGIKNVAQEGDNEVVGVVSVVGNRGVRRKKRRKAKGKNRG